MRIPKPRAAFCLVALCLAPAAGMVEPVASPSVAHGGTGATSAFEVPDWLYPVNPPDAANPTGTPDPATVVSVPGTDARYTLGQIRDLFAVADWHPREHPPMPGVVAHGRRPSLYACGYCHLADGRGRPENATLAGLPAEYIVQQLRDFASGSRRSAWTGPPYLPAALMSEAARLASEEEARAAAAYFSSLRLAQPRAAVVEAERMPSTKVLNWILVAKDGGGEQLLGTRLIEVPRDPGPHERRDPQAAYVAYVPPGSLERGRALALTGNSAAASCASCHGSDLRGIGLVPPIAGRSPTYLLRQLVAFRTGARDTPAGAPMKPVVAGLELQDMIAVAAFAAAQPP